MTTSQTYGVSYGDGHNGVSHMFPDFYVKTNEPWRLARLAILSAFKPKAFEWASKEADIDGEAEYTIAACVYNPPDDEDGSWCEANGAWMICEVFPEEEPRDGVMLYDSIGEAFGVDVLKGPTLVLKSLSPLFYKNRGSFLSFFLSFMGK